MPAEERRVDELFKGRLPDLLGLQLLEIGDTVITLATAPQLRPDHLTDRMVVEGVAENLDEHPRAARGDQRGDLRDGRGNASLRDLADRFRGRLQGLGHRLRTLFAAGAIFAVGVGIAMQNIVQNFVSGVILLTERSIQQGDVLEVDGEVCRVLELGIRATIVRSRDGEDFIVPNSVLVQSTNKNYTMQNSIYRMRTRVGLSYRSDVKKARAVLEKVAEEIPWRLGGRSPQIFLQEFGANAVIFEVAIWMDDPWMAPRRLSDLNEAIWWGLKESDLEIAYPQLDLHLDRSVEESLRRVGARA